ncbi:hypothetical protein [Candidatus Villigracilis vicinus]|uniref:hypothetical protein n=1 Tax=Candidatus Villigracilis vicinus TaxID=3140679 RepID=UPI0031E6AE4D
MDSNANSSPAMIFAPTPLHFGQMSSLSVGWYFSEAGHALQFGRHAPKIERGFLGDGVFGDDFPIELDRVIHHAGEFAHHDVQRGDLFGVRFFGVVEGYF